MIGSRPDARPPFIPAWLGNAAAIGWRVLVVFALIVVLADLAVILGTVVASILFAVIVAVMFAPVATRLRDRGWSRTKTAGAVTLLAILVIGLIVIVLAVAVIPLAPGIVAAIQSGLVRLQADVSSSSDGAQVSAALGQARSNAEAWIANQLLNAAGWVATAVTVTILGSILTFFLLQDGDKAWVWALQAAGERQREQITTSGDTALRGVGIWLRGTAAQAAVDAVTDFGVLALLGVPAALALSIFVFFASFIPYLGGLLAMTVLLAVTYATGGLPAAGMLFVAVTLVNVFQTYALAPTLFRGAVRMPPAVVLVALPIGATAAGFVGMFLAVPVVALGFAVAGSLIDVIDVDVTGTPGESTSIVPVWLDRLAQWSWRFLIGLGFLGVAGPPRGPGPADPDPARPRDHPRGDARADLPPPSSQGLEPDERCWDGDRGLDRHHHRRRRPHRGEPGDPDGAGHPGGERRSQTGCRLEPPAARRSAADRVDIHRLPRAGCPGGLAGSVGLAVVGVIGVLLTFYFMRDGSRLWSLATARLAGWRRVEVDAAGGRAVGVLGGYMIGTGAISLFGAATQFVIMVILGIPLALPLAVLSFFGGFIPYIGSFLTTGLAFLVTLALGTPQDAAIMGVYTIVFNVVQGNFVAPLVYGRAVNIHPAIVLLAIPAGAALAGIAGMFLVVPFIGVVAATWRTGLLVLGDGPVTGDGSRDGGAADIGPSTAATAVSAPIS